VVKVILELYVAFSLSSFKSSPMLSVLLSVEEVELLVIPYCHMFENHIHFFVTHFSFNLFLLSSSHGSNPSSYCHHRLPSRPCHCLIFHSFPFTSWIEHVLKHTSKLKFSKLSFQRAITRMKRVLNKSVVPIVLRRCNLSKAISRFQTAQRSIFLPYLLVRVFKIDDSWCVGKEIWRSFWILLFFHCTSLNTCSNLDGKQRLLSQVL
jgi:hypothetical protein